MHAVSELSTHLPTSGIVRHPMVGEAERVLRQSGYIALRRVQCDWNDGVVSLFGKVPSFFLKQMAQTLVAGISGVRRIDNRIHVQ